MSKSDNSDPIKTKFIEALSKKNKKSTHGSKELGDKSKVQNTNSRGKTPKMFRRKSGSA
jgi:hypothetical protein